MRYYEIQISDPTTGKPLVINGPPGATTGPVFTGKFSSLASNGSNNPAALQVNFDIPLSTLASPAGTAFIEVLGIPIQLISQAAQFNGKNMIVYGGMSKGLPLANPAQQGILLQGVINQCYGNWRGTEMSLSFYLLAPEVVNNLPQSNIVLNWKAGTSLDSAVRQTLTTAFPKYTVSGTIGKALKVQNDEHAYFNNALQFAQWVKEISQNIENPALQPQGTGYSGIEIIVQQNKFILSDGTSQTQPKQLSFIDLMGQPNWVGPATVQITMVLRGDLNISDVIKLPLTNVTTQQAAATQFSNSSIFQGVFTINKLRHVGSFRTPSGESWVTVVEAYNPNSGIAAGGASTSSGSSSQ